MTAHAAAWARWTDDYLDRCPHETGLEAARRLAAGEPPECTALVLSPALDLGALVLAAPLIDAPAAFGVVTGFNPVVFFPWIVRKGREEGAYTTHELLPLP